MLKKIVEDMSGKQLCDEIEIGGDLTTTALKTLAGSSVIPFSNAIEAKPLRNALVWFYDAAAVALATFSICLIYWSTTSVRQHDISAAAFVCILTFCLVHRGARDDWERGAGDFRQQFRRILPLAPTLLIAATAGDLVLALFEYAWLPLLEATSIWLASCLAAVLTARWVGRYASAHPFVSRRMARNVAVIGSGANALHVADICLKSAGETIRLVGIFGDTSGDYASAVTNSVDDLIALSREVALDDVIVAIPPGTDALTIVRQLRWRLRGVAVAIYVLPNLLQHTEVGLPVEMFGPLALSVVQCRPLTFQQELYKRLFDVTLALILIVVLAPLFLAIALAVKLDSPGPVLFRQPRVGRNDRPFTVLKFRSMYKDSSDLMAARQTMRSDHRVTRVGRWLRKLSLDELPQVFNVLAGDMSLVGPRPHAPHTSAGGRLLRDAMAEYVLRHQVKPGITGWAQVNGARGALVTLDDLYRRVTYDLEYIQRWSIWFDIRIISMTVLREVFSKHAF